LLRTCGSTPIPAEIYHPVYGSLSYRRNMPSSPYQTLSLNACFVECRTVSRCMAHLLVSYVSTSLQPRTVSNSIVRLRHRQQRRTLSRNTFRFRLYSRCTNSLRAPRVRFNSILLIVYNVLNFSMSAIRLKYAVIMEFLVDGKILCN